MQHIVSFLFFYEKKLIFALFFLHGQHSVMEPGPTPGPWSIYYNLVLDKLEFLGATAQHCRPTRFAHTWWRSQV